MEEIRLKDICDLDNGYAFKSDDYVESSNTLNCRMSNIRPDGSFDILYSAKYLPDEFVKKYKNYVLNDGDLIIAMTDMAGDPKILGVPTVVDTKGYKLLLNQRVGRLRFIRDGINADYLKFALQCKRVRDYLKMFAGGGVQLNVSKKDILNAPIRMRAIGEQQSIADLLKRIIKLQKLREQELQHFDNLIKARFVEMFGDQRYPQEPLDNNVYEMFIGPFGSALKNECFVEPENGYCMVYEQKHAIQKTMDVTTRYVNEKKYLELKRFSVYPGDIIVSCRGTIGEIFTVPKDAPLGIMHPSIMKIRLNTEKYDQKFFVLALEQYMNEHINEAKGSGVKMAVTATTLGKESFVIPPMEVQKQFADFVKQVDKSKVVVPSKIKNAIFVIMLSVSFGQITSI
jgi:type I restriction enzyme S subunit